MAIANSASFCKTKWQVALAHGRRLLTPGLVTGPALCTFTAAGMLPAIRALGGSSLYGSEKKPYNNNRALSVIVTSWIAPSALILRGRPQQALSGTFQGRGARHNPKREDSHLQRLSQLGKAQ